MLSAKASESCIILSTPDNISIRAASYVCENARKNGIQDVRLVVNKFNKKLHKKINVDEVIDLVGARLLGIVPESRDIALTAIGEELPYDSKGNMAYLRIAKRILGENIPFRAKNRFKSDFFFSLIIFLKPTNIIFSGRQPNPATTFSS